MGGRLKPALRTKRPVCSPGFSPFERLSEFDRLSDRLKPALQAKRPVRSPAFRPSGRLPKFDGFSTGSAFLCASAPLRFNSIAFAERAGLRTGPKPGITYGAW